MAQDSLILTGEAARILGVSPEMVRYLERMGHLPARRTGGVRLFERKVVEQLARDRQDGRLQEAKSR